MTKTGLIPLLFFLTSCFSNDPQPANKAELIAGSDAFGKTYSIGQIEIELGTLQPHRCLTDNFITYYPDGRYEVNEGATKCDPTDPPALTGTWDVNEEATILTVVIDGEVQIWNVESVNRHTHRISSQFVEGLRIYSLNAL